MGKETSPAKERIPYDWTQGRTVEFYHDAKKNPKLQKFRAYYIWKIEETEPEKEWWDHTLQSIRKTSEGLQTRNEQFAQTRAYLSNPKLAELIGMWAETSAAICLRERHPNLFSFQIYSPDNVLKKTERNWLEFQRFWGKRIKEDNIPTAEELQKPSPLNKHVTTNHSLWHTVIQISLDPITLPLRRKMPYLFSMSREGAQEAITAYLEELMRNKKKFAKK